MYSNKSNFIDFHLKFSSEFCTEKATKSTCVKKKFSDVRKMQFDRKSPKDRIKV